ncbi:hypothetical protein FHG87_017806 [Trinorchestia longiramus]|nr:hypothetical protein FHG87_017806 [Trinorchestia longiramus]
MQLLVFETTQTFSTLFIFKALITSPEFPEPPSYCPIPCRLFSPCSVDIGRSFGGVVPKFELVQHKLAKVMFCRVHHGWILSFKIMFCRKRNYKILMSTH